MFIKNKEHQKIAKVVYLTLSFLLNASQQTFAIDPLPAEDAPKAIGFKLPTINLPSEPDSSIEIIDESLAGIKNKSKVAVIDGPFDPQSDTESVLSLSTKNSIPDKRLAALRAFETKNWENHANHVSSIIHARTPDAELRVINLHDVDSVAEAINAAIKSKVTFINLSISLRGGGISEDIKKALYKARDEGIGVIMAAGNDSEEIGSTAYTRSLASLVKRMKGSMILVAATSGANGQEKLASFSNKAGLASKYTVSAPGTDIQAYGAFNRLVNMSGTSMAAPAVTAVASSLMSAYPTLSPKEVLRVIRYSARGTTADQSVTFEKQTYGWGVLDSSAADRMARDIQSLRVIHRHS